jgi:hypothetical protein
MSQAGDLNDGSISPDIPTEFVADIGTAVPIANTIEILGDTVAAGTTPVYTSASGNTLITNVQISQAIAVSNATNIGLSAFNSGDFTVDANGFVSLIGGSAAIDSIHPDSGTDPVLPTVAGLVNIIGSGSTTTVGSLNTLTIQLTGLTNHAVLVGAGTSTITKVGPTATIGQVLQSAGAAADPAFSTATYPLTTTINQILYSSAANTITGLATANRGVLTTGATGVPVVTALATDGQLIIGSTAGAPAAASLTSLDSSITITPGSNSISLTVAGGTSVGKTITGNTGGALSPTAGNWNIVTSNATTVFAGAVSTLTLDYNITNLILGSSLPSLTTGARNVGVGSNVLNALTSSTDNTAIGASALQAVTIGDLNTAIGSAAAASVNSGSANNAFGRNALLACTSGGNNCAMGFGALGNCNTSHNVAIGHTSSVNVTSGAFNTSVGSISLASATTGTQNTAIGYSALSLSNGSYNVALGLNAGSTFVSTESSNILIANNGTTSDNNTIRIGTQGSGSGQQNLCFVAGITGVTVSGSAPVGVNTNGQLSSLGFGTSGQVLTSNGAATSPTFQAIPSTAMTWTEVSGAFSSAVNNGYIITNTASTTLPASPTVGQTIKFIVDTTNVLTVTANTGQIFRLNTSVSATAGTAVNVARGASITFVYAPTSASWIASESVGSWTLT